MNINDLINHFKKNMPSDVLGRKANPEALAYSFAGDNYLKENDYYQAIIHYSKAIELDPTNQYSLSKRGKCYQMTKAYDKALADLFKSKAIDDNFQNNQGIAECYLFLKDFQNAISFFDIALKELENMATIDNAGLTGIDYASTKSRALNNKATCHYNLGQIDVAIQTTTKGIEANPNYPNNYSIRGMLYLQQGNKAQAKTDLQNAARLGDPRANAILSQI